MAIISEASSGSYGKAYRNYVLVLLTFVYTLNSVDRNLVNLLLQPIKEDLHLSDTQLGLLTGIAFGLFYATLGVPIGRWADRGNRTTISSLAIGLWGLTVMLTVWVGNFVQLVFARMAAAVGEAGCMPPAYSLIGDYFPEPGARAKAMSVYWVASPLASLIGFVVGGWLNEHFGWRATFFIMGCPAFVIALLVKFTVREPRLRAGPKTVSDKSVPNTLDVLTELWRQRSSRQLIIAIILIWTLSIGLGPWYAAFMMRSHFMGTAELGLWMGFIGGAGGVIGILLGGQVVSRWLGNNERGQMRLSAVTMVAVVPALVCFLFLPGKMGALIVFMPLIILLTFFLGPTFALMQRLVLNRSRATALAAIMLLANLIGIGLGPLAVGVLSDFLAPKLGTESLRYAMLIVSLLAIWAAVHLWKVGDTVQGDLADIAARQTQEVI